MLYSGQSGSQSCYLFSRQPDSQRCYTPGNLTLRLVKLRVVWLSELLFILRAIWLSELLFILQAIWLSAMLYSGQSDSQSCYLFSGQSDSHELVNWLPREISFPIYCSYTPRRLTCRGIIFWEDWLAGVLYFGKIDSPEYYILGRLTRQSIIFSEDWLGWMVYSREISASGNILTGESPGFYTPGILTLGTYDW